MVPEGQYWMSGIKMLTQFVVNGLVDCRMVSVRGLVFA